jgi:hypothetical protein
VDELSVGRLREAERKLAAAADELATNARRLERAQQFGWLAQSIGGVGGTSPFYPRPYLTFVSIRAYQDGTPRYYLPTVKVERLSGSGGSVVETQYTGSSGEAVIFDVSGSAVPFTLWYRVSKAGYVPVDDEVDVPVTEPGMLPYYDEAEMQLDS